MAHWIRKPLFLAFFIISTVCQAQFGNEWIRFNQSYYRIPIAKDSLYRLTFSDLANAGFPASMVDPRRIQLFHRGVEQAIYVEGESDATFDPTDYIEFFGKRNDGTLDAGLYEPASNQPHAYRNIYSDTTAYFLTYNPGAVLGKRMSNFSEVNVSGIPKESFAFDERLLVLSNEYSGGYTENIYFQKASFDQGEGWTGTMIREGQSLDYVLSKITGGAPAGGLPQLEMLLTGRGDMAHRVEISVGANSSSLRTLTAPSFSGFATQLFSTALNWTDINTDGKLTVRVRTIGISGTPDRISVSYIKVRYPRAVSMDGGKNTFKLSENSTGKSYVEIANPVAQARLYDITDLSKVVRIGTSGTTTLNAVIPNTTTARKLKVVNSFTTPSVKKVAFRQIDPHQADYIIISNRFLMRPAGGYNNPVRAYGAYRASVPGGSYDTLVVDVVQLYDQFNYGEPSSLAIRRFMQYLTSTGSPKYLFLIGKGLDVNYDYFRYANSSSYSYFKNLVPTAGYPASDMNFTAGLSGTGYEPAVATGRIPALLPEHVAAYLNKAIEMDAEPYDALWRKNLLHLSGGINQGEPERFKSHLEGFQATAENAYLGGTVKAISKRSTDIDFINVADEVNAGLNLITFFGHSSAVNIDFDIGNVTDPALGYNNAGKYPTLLLNGCSAGSFFINRTLFGENWINAANKGAIGFIAHTSYGLENTLQQYSGLFYKVGYGDETYVKRGLGDIQKEVARQYMQTAPPTTVHIAQVQQMVLLGDPAIKLFGAASPDYAITDSDVSIESFDGSRVTAMSDSFAIKINVKNYGVTSNSNFLIRVSRTLADNSVVTYDSVFNPVYYSDTLTFVIHRGNSSEGGTNAFKIEIDPNNLVEELSEENNVVTSNFLIPLNGTKNLYPIDYGIVHDAMVNLRFQTTDQMADDRQFIVEIDTTASYSSNFKKEIGVVGKVLGAKLVEILDKDSTVYYWRTKLAQPQAGESTEWEQSSFTFINHGQDGWAQMRFPQFIKNKPKGLTLDTLAEEIILKETVTSVYINNFGSAAGTSNLNVSVKLNGAEYQLPFTSTTERVPCRNNTINLIAFDKTTTTPYPGIPFNFQDSRTCGKEPEVIVSFQLNELEYVNPTTGVAEGISTYVDNIAAGDSVVLFSIGDAGFPSWPAAVKAKLGELGIAVAQLASLQAGEPVVIFARKGATPGSAVVHRTSGLPANQQSLQTNLTITGRAVSGTLTSTLIGPSAKWEKLVSRMEKPEASDARFVDVIGVSINGEETTLMSGVNSDVSLSDIDTKIYPYLRLVYQTSDPLNLTATQLNKWLVLYTPVAEGILTYEGLLQPLSLVEGQQWMGNYRFVNISDQVFPDSLMVDVNYFNSVKRASLKIRQTIKSPAPGDTTRFTVTLPTVGRGGLNDVDVNVNPHIVPEQYYDNNMLRLSNYLNVLVDKFDPVMEVTFDGRVLINDDFVSPHPKIKMRLWDENDLIIKTDTLGVKIRLTYPCDLEECNDSIIYLNRKDVQWFAATEAEDFTVLFEPTDLPGGRYTLSVELSDDHGNASGTAPYEINFQVSGGETAAYLLDPYPNPSTNFFTFTLVSLGADAPDNFTVEIFSMDGRKIIDLASPAIHTGTNEFIWNTMNSNGAQLPAGVYIYKMYFLKDGKRVNIDVPAAGTAYRNKGFGKLVLTR